MFRQDFIVFIPVIAIAVLFFHGKIHHNFVKKTVIIISLVAGLVLSMHLPGRIARGGGFAHVLYIGLSDNNDQLLNFSSDNYSKSIIYTDKCGFVCASAKAYRDMGIVNVRHFSKEYDQVLKKELFGLIQMYPYDFFRLALSSAIQNLFIGSRSSENPIKWIDSAPGYWMFQKNSRIIYDHLPLWFCYLILCLSILFFLGNKFYNNMLFCIAVMALSGSYLFQYNPRHYFYLMLIPMLASGFVISSLFRFSYVLVQNPKKIKILCLRKKLLVHCSVFVGLFILAFCILFTSKFIQEIKINNEINSLNADNKETIAFQESKVPSKLQRGVSATDISLPNIYDSILSKENNAQLYFVEIFKICFKVIGAAPKDKMYAFAKYENISSLETMSRLSGSITRLFSETGSYPFPYLFTIGDDLNTLYIPVYLSREKKSSPFTGFELFANGKDISVESVERIVKSDKFHTMCAFLVPSQPDEMTYAGKMDWNNIFWGDKK